MAHPSIVETVPPRRSRRVVAGAVVAAALGVLVWMWWPSVAGNGDVLLVGDTAAGDVLDTTVLTVRDNGRQAAVAPLVASPCAVADAVRAAQVPDGTDIVVIVASDVASCPGSVLADAADAAREQGLDPVLVRLPDAPPPDVDALVVDMEPLLGPAGTPSRPCEWWDVPNALDPPAAVPCIDGNVAVRLDDGTLSEAGVQRVARAVAAAIG